MRTFAVLAIAALLAAIAAAVVTHQVQAQGSSGTAAGLTGRHGADDPPGDDNGGRKGATG
jgi:opacity protein-like surface antigen